MDNSEINVYSNDMKYAVLIDADNISSKYIGTIFDEISKKGRATIKRIYADWTKPQVCPWKEINLEYSITPIQQYSYTVGKNATDSAMIIDAMDILYSGNVDGFCLVSSDSDFTRLAARLREAGKNVIGMGKQQTPAPFVKACAEFKFVDILSGEEESIPPEGTTKPAPKGTASKIKKEKSSQTPLKNVKAATFQIIEEESNDDGWMLASLIGVHLKKRFPDFDSRNYGHKKLLGLLEEFNLQIKKIQDPNNKQNPTGLLVYVAIKN